VRGNWRLEMRQGRVTKHNPEFRDSAGAFRKDVWTDFDDIGRSIGGTVLTLDEYQKVENRYVLAALHFAREANVTEFLALDVERRNPDIRLVEGMHISTHSVPSIMRQILRNQVWCKLENRAL